MPTYLHPGVYIEEIPSGVKPIEGVGTSTAAFVGFTTKGPIGEAQLLLKRDDYDSRYGGLRDLGAAAIGDRMGLSVSAFFQNGGTKAYIVRLAQNAASARGYMEHPAAANTTHGLEFTALNEGVWADGIVARLTPKASDPLLYTVEIGRLDDADKLVVDEIYANVSLDSTSPRFISAVINGVSNLVTVSLELLTAITDPAGYFLGTSTSGDLAGVDIDLSSEVAANRQLTISLDGLATFTITLAAVDFTANLPVLAAEIQEQVRTNGNGTVPEQEFTCAVDGNTLVLTSGTRVAASSVAVSASALATRLGLGGIESTGQQSLAARVAGNQAELVDGADGQPALLADYQTTFTRFEKIRDINMILLPDHAWDAAGQPFLQDPPASTELITEKNVTDLQLPTSTYTVNYYPWVKVANPFYDDEDNPGVPATLLAPPGAYGAGMWSKIDGKRGVWKAPAGLETRLSGLAGLQFQVEDGEQDQLNPLGVNAYRVQPGFGSVIWGARTLSTRADPEWRYVPVRRTALFIEQSVYSGIQWAVFEPNDHNLWASLRLNVGSFMDGLFRASAFQGAKASDAYFVRCGLGDTMTQGDIDRGQVIVIVGFAPLKPAEFVIVRIQQKVAQQ
jgi:phage tail sheath protein FI